MQIDRNSRATYYRLLISLVQDGLRRDVPHLRFYMLSRARKTHVREKLKNIFKEKYFC